MSDNLDVVPQESVVDFPSEYEPEANADTEKVEAEANESEADEEPVSLDDPPEAEDDEADEAEPDEADEEDPEETAEVIEFDFGGNKLAIPKDAIPAELAEKVDSFSKEIWADYTKKSQANAETAARIEARAEALDNIETLTDETLNAFSRGKNLKSEIEQLSAVNLNELWQSDPDRARMISDTLAAKQAELHGIINSVDQYERNLKEARQSEIARRIDEGKQVLDRKIKGFSTEIAPKLVDYAIRQGIPDGEAKNWAASPVMTEMAYKAMLYDQMQAAKTPKVAPKKATPVRSMQNKGGNRQATNTNDMSFSELGKLLGIK